VRIGRVAVGDDVGWGLLGREGTAPLPCRSVAELAAWVAAGAAAAAGAPTDATPLPAEPLLAPGKILGVGFNYQDHAQEAGGSPPTHPVFFSQLPATVSAHGLPIRVDPDLTAFADAEAELAVIVGRPMRAVPVDRALDHVLGYTAANDVSARDLQSADEQWFRAKNLETFCPLGPWIVSAEEVGDPQALAIRGRLNGETVQDASTAQMRFSVAELLSFCSRYIPLEPGDVLLTGTPAGVGMSRQPPRPLRDGDVYEVEVERVGVLRNAVEELAG
jgi:2-keto-4-pentenoate hydratase/2-oxohepta-3-ene-1,7-dioic acid hydratase in catechol pathway